MALWDNYQKLGNSAKWRIDNLNLRQFASKDKTLLDLGANQGEFSIALSKDFMHIIWICVRKCSVGLANVIWAHCESFRLHPGLRDAIPNQSIFDAKGFHLKPAVFA